MIKDLRLFLLWLVILTFSLNAKLQAQGLEPGVFDALTTVQNLLFPPQADNPVTDAQTQGMYPLVEDDPDFDDNFKPRAYERWQRIDVPVSTGAMCGNGTPYKFFVYPRAHTNNTLFYFEGGGACWDFDSCSGKNGILGARNPNGIPDNYVKNIVTGDFDDIGEGLSNLSTAAASPLIWPWHPWNKYKTSDWNLVYVPYCTGDIYIGDKIEVYVDPAGQEDDLIWHHNGLRNVQAVVSWVKNNLQKPAQMAVAGCSAGSIGGLLNYSKLRQDMEVDYGYLIDDSGPLYLAPLDSSDTDSYPSVPLHKEVISSWTTFTQGGDPEEENPINALAGITPGFDTNELASLYAGLSNKFPNDRLGVMHFLADGNFSAYSYERFYDDINNDPDPVSRLEKLREKWQYDTDNNLITILDQTSNWSYYFPRYRNLNDSHCTTIVDFEYGEIAERGLVVKAFLDNLVNYQGGPPLRAYESDEVSDFENNNNLFYSLLNELLL
ncbi:MAG: pectinacetylesterase family protein [Gammaproteobacteria bacterium]|nr:pectinacetylesterase family protein [Gammaproteobacteria bacterium]